MINIKKKADCSGCHACANICPKKCIAMKADEEGFLYPSVNLSECVKCGLCQKVCHHHNTFENHAHPEAYACYSTDESVRIKSSSGGIFTLLAKEILNHGGAVFGAAFDEDLTVKHICITQEQDLPKLQGSKYLQSSIGDTYSHVKEILQSGKTVFFTGTPCQIGGLKLYLGKQYENLYTADVICHGAPSPKVWKIYLEHLEAQHHTKVNKRKQPFFREKTLGWLGFSLHISFENGEEYCAPVWKDSYMGAFINDLTLRPSCYHCDFKSLDRNSDITMADFWGIDKLMPDMFDNKGTSLILLNSKKGKNLFKNVKESIVCKPISLDKAIKHNPLAYRSAALPFKRKKFMSHVNSENFANIYQACVKRSLPERILHKLKRLFKYLCMNVQR